MTPCAISSRLNHQHPSVVELNDIRSPFGSWIAQNNLQTHYAPTNGTYHQIVLMFFLIAHTDEVKSNNRK